MKRFVYNYGIRFLVVTCLLMIIPMAQAAPLRPDEAFKFSFTPLSGDIVLVEVSIAPGYYLYQETLRFRVTGWKTGIGRIDYPMAIMRNDPKYGATWVYGGYLQLMVPIKKGRGAMESYLSVDYRGCGDEGVCYPLMSKTYALK